MADPGLVGLELLEEKIVKAAQLIERLREEKKAAEESNKVLKEKIDLLYINNEELSKELEIFNRNKENKKDFDKTREEINNKIEEMLVKLDSLEI